MLGFFIVGSGDQTNVCMFVRQALSVLRPPPSPSTFSNQGPLFPPLRPPCQHPIPLGQPHHTHLTLATLPPPSKEPH
jgi:hypothetical protein